MAMSLMIDMVKSFVMDFLLNSCLFLEVLTERTAMKNMLASVVNNKGYNALANEGIRTPITEPSMIKPSIEYAAAGIFNMVKIMFKNYNNLADSFIHHNCLGVFFGGVYRRH